MADFVAILKKTIDSQGITTPELRARVYTRARQTIEQKLSALVPPPTSEQKTRQMKSLDDAILVVEQSYSATGPTQSPAADPLEAFISEAEASARTVAGRAQPMRPVPPQPSPFSDRLPPVVQRQPVSAPPPVTAANRAEPARQPAKGPQALPEPAPQDASGAKGASRSLVWAVAGVLLAVGAGYGAWSRWDDLSGYYQKLTAGAANSQPEVKKVTTTSVKPASPAEPPASEPAPATAENSPVGEQKFTQRLTPEGEEVDGGPAPGSDNGVGEGETVAQVTTLPAPADPSTPPDAAAAVGEPAGEPAPAVGVAVGQKAVFYEEKTGTEEGTVDQGAVVWSVVQDSPGTGQPEEPAIRAEITVPEKSIKLRLTIKRNADKTLPASHIIEMVFSVPEGFSGGSVEGVQRVTFKDTEQAPGNPLVGVPASFGEGFFLIALTDEKTAIEANMALMTRQSWIDIPLTYKSGRRALISIEKGLPGDKVFQDVFKVWQAKASG